MKKLIILFSALALIISSCSNPVSKNQNIENKTVVIGYENDNTS
jgi:PBP1b-binding outer membrane lipoprotein LpoB